MPRHRVGAAVEEFQAGLVLCSAMDKMDLWESRGSPTVVKRQSVDSKAQVWRSIIPRRVNMKPAKVSSKFQSLFDREVCKVLVPESNDFLLCDQESQFVLALVVQCRELYTSHLCPD